MRDCFPSILVLGVAVSAGCSMFGLSAEEKKTLSHYEGNAQTYFDGQKFDQAEDQVRKGLAIDPKNYKLNLVEAMILLQRGKTDPRVLPQALDQFEKTKDLRPTGKLDSRTNLGLGMCNQQMAQVLKDRAMGLRKDLESNVLTPDEKQQRKTKADDADRNATIYLKDARTALEELVESKELLALAHYHLFQVATLERNLVDAQKHGDYFRQEADRRQVFLAAQLQTSFDTGRDAALREEQRDLRGRQVEVLGLLANIAFKRKDHAGSVKYLDELLKLDSTRTAEYLNRARCELALESYTRAKEDVEVFLRQTQLSFESTQVKEALEMRRSLEKRVLDARQSPAEPGRKPLGDGR